MKPRSSKTRRPAHENSSPHAFEPELPAGTERHRLHHAPARQLRLVRDHRANRRRQVHAPRCDHAGALRTRRALRQRPQPRRRHEPPHRRVFRRGRILLRRRHVPQRLAAPTRPQKTRRKIAAGQASRHRLAGRDHHRRKHQRRRRQDPRTHRARLRPLPALRPARAGRLRRVSKGRPERAHRPPPAGHRHRHLSGNFPSRLPAFGGCPASPRRPPTRSRVRPRARARGARPSRRRARRPHPTSQ